MRIRSCISVVLAASIASTASAQDARLPRHDTLWIRGGDYQLRVKTFRNPTLSSRPVLLVVLHGDAPFSKPDYHDVFASRVASANADVVAAAILRPGYTDPEGHRSDGVRGHAVGDNYNAANTRALAEVFAALKARYSSRRVVVAAHSGGATLAANILNHYPDVIDAAVLVACSCDVSKWRAHMFVTTRHPLFRGTVETLSPIQSVERSSPKAEIVMFVGEKDNVTPPFLTTEYAAAATAAGKRVRVTIIPEKEHEIFFHPQVVAAVAELLK
ncbi:MAG: hypothetical protein EON54_23900 [Alcaligenaceae bacterium]|nr:MAG: hypothetical protein EON54_23900 [Alcaligenaceae bacterium]